MFKPPIRTWISNATAVLSREHGSATRQAQESRCSRETLYRHPDKLVQRLTNEPAHMVVHLRTEKQRLNESIAGLRREAQHRILLDKDERRRLATTAYAMSVGLRQVEDLLGRRQGRRRETTRERRAWSGANRPRRLDEATALFENAQRLESAWDRAHAAPDLFRHDGRLNDRTWAEAEIAAALAVLTGLDWSKVRTFLNDARSLAILDRMRDRLKTAEPRANRREALAWRSVRARERTSARTSDWR